MVFYFDPDDLDDGSANFCGTGVGYMAPAELGFCSELISGHAPVGNVRDEGDGVITLYLTV
jgi:hypothetical protein